MGYREDKIATELIRKKERELGRKLTNEEVVENFQEAEKKVEKQRKEHKREHRISKIKRKIVAILATLGIAIGGGTVLLNPGEEPEPEHPSGQETDIDNGKNNETSKTDREKFLEGLQEGVGENTNEGEQDIENTIDKILQEYNAKLPEGEKIDKDDLGIIFRDNVGEGHVIEVTSEDGEISYVENPLITGDLPEGQEWVEAQYVDDEYILVDTENEDILGGMVTLDNELKELDAHYVNFGGKEYAKNDQTYVGIPEDVDLEKAYKDFSDYYQTRVQQQEQQAKNESQIQDDGRDR